MRRRSGRAHSLSPNLGRTASPICPDLIYDRHKGRLCQLSPRSTATRHQSHLLEVIPPSTYKVCPVTNPDAGAAKDNARPTMSFGSAIRPSGIRSSNCLRSSKFSTSDVVPPWYSQDPATDLVRATPSARLLARRRHLSGVME